MAPTIEVSKLTVEPNNCEFARELALHIEWATNEDIPQARWQVQYVVDAGHTRSIIRLGVSEPQEYKKGEHVYDFEVDQLSNEEDLDEKVLKNTGLLMATLLSEKEEIVQITMVTQVAKKGGKLMRLVFNPLE